MICTDCGSDKNPCDCDIHHYVSTGEKRRIPPSLELERLTNELNALQYCDHWTREDRERDAFLKRRIAEIKRELWGHIPGAVR